MEFLDVSHDPEALRRWYDVYSASCRTEAVMCAWAYEELLAESQIDWPRRTIAHWAGIDAGEIVAAGSIGLPQLDHLQHAHFEVHVRPDLRRRGYGSDLLRHLETQAVATGRHIFGAEATYPLEAPHDGRGTPGADFLTSHGYACALSDVARTLELPVPTERLRELMGRAAAHHRDYRLLTFGGEAPAWAEEQVRHLDASLPTEAPTGELSLEAETVDAEADRIARELLAAQGRTKIRTIAVIGDVVAVYTDLVHPEYDATRAYQWGTLVHRDHRGHRLGLALKAANLLAYQERFPELAELLTFNAESNRHMVAVNDALGMRPVARMGKFEKQVPSAM